MASSMTGLDASYIQMINNLMELERQPLTRLTTRKDALQVQRAVYTDLKGQIDQLQSAVKALKPSDAFFSMTPGRKVNVTPSVTGAAVVSATASSSAVSGSYVLSDVTLAKEHRVRSDRQTYVDQALGLTGTFVLGGGETRTLTGGAASINTGLDTVSGFGLADPVSGQKELGTGSYKVEMREDPANAGTWQFRLVDNDHKAVSIRKTDDTGYTDGWQTLADGASSYNTGRGLTIGFGATRSSASVDVTYNAKGVTINLEAQDSLNDLIAEINKASYADGNNLVASVVDHQLILSTVKTGSSRAIVAKDTSGTVLQSLGLLKVDGSFKNQIQAASDASFKINGLQVTRSQNTGLTDVIGGVTMNLASDAEGKTATLSISADTSGMRKTIDEFINKFNGLQTYLDGKLAVVKQADGTYKRGSLSGDMVFVGLRADMIRIAGQYTIGYGQLKSLRDIGVEIGDGMKLKVVDAAKLEGALSGDYENVKSLFDNVMTELNTKLERFNSTKGYVSQAIIANDSETESLKNQINTINVRLDARQEALIAQYAEAQAQLDLLLNQQKQFGAFYGTYS